MPLLLCCFSSVNRLHSKVLIASFLISGPRPFYLVLSHAFTPNDGVAANEVVRAARKIPTTNGRKQSHSFAVKCELPANRTKWRNHLQSASAKAVVDCCCIGDRHIKNSFLSLLRDALNE